MYVSSDQFSILLVLKLKLGLEILVVLCLFLFLYSNRYLGLLRERRKEEYATTIISIFDCIISEFIFNEFRVRLFD